MLHAHLLPLKEYTVEYHEEEIASMADLPESGL